MNATQNAKTTLNITEKLMLDAFKTKKLQKLSPRLRTFRARHYEWKLVSDYISKHVTVLGIVSEKKIRECILKAGIKDVDGFLERHPTFVKGYSYTVKDDGIN